VFINFLRSTLGEGIPLLNLQIGGLSLDSINFRTKTKVRTIFGVYYFEVATICLCGGIENVMGNGSD
jgi:hypothetical protein